MNIVDYVYSNYSYGISSCMNVIKEKEIKIKAHIPLKTHLRWVPKANEINTKKHEMYVANARHLSLGPNATYIPLTCILVSH